MPASMPRRRAPSSPFDPDAPSGSYSSFQELQRSIMSQQREAMDRAMRDRGSWRSQAGYSSTINIATPSTSTNHSYAFLDFNDPIPAEPSKAKVAKMVKGLEQSEQTSLKDFMEQGTGLNMYASGDEITAIGEHIRGSELLFQITDSQLLVDPKRSSHLMPQLTKLAASEGLELKTVNETPTIGPDTRRVQYYALRSHPTFDDTALVTITNPMLESAHSTDDCVEMDCEDCEELYRDDVPF